MSALTSPTQLLERAGARAVVAPVGRPSSPVAHVYVGPLTRAGCGVPRRGRPVCGARTRRLTVCPPVVSSARRVCARCSARLVRQTLGRAEHTPATREGCRARWAHLTSWDFTVLAWVARDVATVERLEWLTLLIVGWPACARVDVTAPSGRTLPPVDVHVARGRTRVGAGHVSRYDERRADQAATAEAAAREARDLTRAAREAAIERHGFSAVVPGRPGAPART